MKKIRNVFTVSFLLLIGITINGFSQDTPNKDFYIGNWELLVKNTPMGGDMNSTMEIKEVDGKLSGTMTMGDPSMGMTVEFTSVTIEGEKLAVSFDMMGNEAKIEYSKKDENSITGKLMDSPIEGTKKE